jgi:hypothetical protein
MAPFLASLSTTKCCTSHNDVSSLVVLPPSDDLCGNDISYYGALLITGSLLCFDVITTIMVFVASSEHSDNEVVQAAAEGTK